MSTMLIAQDETRESGSFMGDQLSSLKAAYLFVQNTPDVDRVLMSVSPGNEMAFVWERFIRDPRGDGSIPAVELVHDNWNPGDWEARHTAWNKWRKERALAANGKVVEFDHYRELYLRIHGNQRQTALCGSERGLGRRNIFSYWYYGQENMPDSCVGDGVYDVEIDHPPHKPTHDVWISPHAKTQGNVTFTFVWWADVVHKLIDAGVSVTVGYDGYFCEELLGNPLYRKYWGSHRQWMEGICSHKLVACGNTGTGWLAAACGVPMITMEPPNSQMPDHRYRECGLRNIVEAVDTPDPDYVARRIVEEVNRVVVLTTGCYDVLHAGHVRHLERSKALGTKLIVALNSDESVRNLKGTIEGVQRPINPQGAGKAVLEALRCVDEVRLFDGPDALNIIREIRPQVLTVGHGYIPSAVVGRDLVEEYGGRVVVTCHGDARDEPSTTKIVRKMIRSGDIIEACRVGASVRVNPYDKLKLLAEQLLSVADLPGDVADLGSYRGGAALVMRRLAPDKRLHLFDTWAGTPHDDPLCHHRKGEWVAQLEECRGLVGNSELTRYHVGMFPHAFNPDDTNDILVNEFCFVYVDMDTYQSTRDAIAFFWPRLVSGGKMLLDDWMWHACKGVEKAVGERFPDQSGADYQCTAYPSQYTMAVTKR